MTSKLRTPTPEAQARLNRIKALTHDRATLVDVQPDGGIVFAFRMADGDTAYWAIDATGGRARMIGT